MLQIFLQLFIIFSINFIIILKTVAGIGRASFCRNYTQKADILTEYIDVLLADLTAQWFAHEGAPLSEQVRRMISRFESHRAFYQVLNDRNMIHLLRDSLLNALCPEPQGEAVQAYAVFATYTIYGWIDIWFRRGMKESADELYEIFHSQGL